MSKEGILPELPSGDAQERCQEAQHSGGWRPIETAPKDGTYILAWCVHGNQKYANADDHERWACAVIATWIDHNDGGWTGYGLAGVLTHWMPLPPPPEDTALSGGGLRAPSTPGDSGMTQND